MSSKVEERRESVEERKHRLRSKMERMRRPNGKPPPKLEDDEVTDVYDLALSELEHTAEACERETRERVRSISQITKAVQQDLKEQDE